MKLTGVTSERKRLHAPWVLLRLWNFTRQDAAGTDIFSSKKGPNRLIEEKLTEGCHVQDETSASEF